MKDWIAIARASGLAIAASELERIVGPLEALDRDIRPLFADLTPDAEPDVEFRPDEEAR